MMGCLHDWKILSETVTKSKFESAMSIVTARTDKTFTIPAQMCDASRKHIQIVTCTKCGRMKRFVEDI